MNRASQHALTPAFTPIDLERPIAIADGRTISARELFVAASAVRRQVEGAADGTWGIHASSPLQLIAALTALQSLNRNAVLLPYAEVEYLESIGQSFAGILTESTPCTSNAAQLQPLNVLFNEGRGERPLICKWQHPIGVMTSGSAGTPITVFRTPPQILAETDMLERAFGHRIDANRVFHGTTNHQHLYGFCFRVMWPLLSGRLFADTQIRVPGDVSRAIKADKHIVLISSPAFLSQARHLMDFERLSAANLIGFSSGSLLDADTATHFNANRRIELIEIYGSTETGAVASRVTKTIPAPSWRPLPEIEIDIRDDILNVRGRQLPVSDWYVTADRAEWLDDGGFELIGRTDRIVKVADKRVSLTELERLTAARADINDARVILLDSGVLGCVVVPSDVGWAALQQQGKALFVRAIRDDLIGAVDRVTAPKRWRVVKRLPVNTQGKVELALLQQLFQNTPATPAWDIVLHDGDHWIGEAEITPNLPQLAGHFPGEPIVPGVAQIAWAARTAREAFGLDELTGNMEVIKFRNPIRPGVRVQLSLRLDRIKGKVHFEIADGEQSYTIGRLLTKPR